MEYGILSLFDSYFKTITDNTLHKQRLYFDTVVFGILKSKYGKLLHDFWKSYKPPLESDKSIVFVERRCHPNLQFCIQNAAYFARGWSISIYCSLENFQYILEILGDNKDNVTVVVQFENDATPEEGRSEYNQLLQDKSFWESVPGEHVLVCETDAYLLRPIPDDIFKYDYAASLWAWNLELHGGAGLSYRKRSCMLEVCEAFPEKHGYQDTYCEEGLRKLHKKFIDGPENQYFVESCFTDDAIGVHQWWTFVDKENIYGYKEYILSYFDFIL
jgi:hypothetical protein